MSSIEHRRRAWAALKLGPLWQPVAGALPNAPSPEHTCPSAPDTAVAEAESVTGSGASAAHETADAFVHHAEALPSPLAPSPTASGPAEDAPIPNETWMPVGEQDMPEEAWQAMEAEAAHYASSGALMAEDWLPVHDAMSASPSRRLSSAPSAAGMSRPADESAPASRPDGKVPSEAQEADEDQQTPTTGAVNERVVTTPPRPDRSLPDEQRWQQLREAVSSCHRCGLADTRQNTVFGRGRTGQTRWMLVGEAPGAEEDRRGEAFVGQAGQLLDAMLSAAGIDPATEVFIANVLKCRPPGNRNPELYEVNQCEGYLHEQIRLANPECILLLGRFAAQSVLNSSLSINRLRNRVHHIRLAGRDVPVVCTFHPAYLLRNPLDKLKSWEDLCLARSVLDNPGHEKLPLPPRRSGAH